MTIQGWLMRGVMSYRAQIMDLVATVLGAAPSGDQPLMEAGLDSLGAVDLRNAVSGAFGVELPPTATLDYPTVDALAKFIVSSLAPADSKALVDPGYWSDDMDLSGEAEAALTHITGLSCIYPGVSAWASTGSHVCIHPHIHASAHSPACWHAALS